MRRRRTQCVTCAGSPPSGMNTKVCHRVGAGVALASVIEELQRIAAVGQSLGWPGGFALHLQRAGLHTRMQSCIRRCLQPCDAVRIGCGQLRRQQQIDRAVERRGGAGQVLALCRVSRGGARRLSARLRAPQAAGQVSMRRGRVAACGPVSAGVRRVALWFCRSVCRRSLRRRFQTCRRGWLARCAPPWRRRSRHSTSTG